MNAITLHDAFVPQGCKGAAPRAAVTVGAGARWLQTYEAVTTRAGRYVQGGGCCTVGVAGLIQSGGFGSFSKNFGMAAASLLEAEVVTADGKVRVANACSDPELFWGLKGGGGGSLGVVTKVTLATHELPQLMGGVSGAIRAKSDAALRGASSTSSSVSTRRRSSTRTGASRRLSARTTPCRCRWCSPVSRTTRPKPPGNRFCDFVAAAPGDFEVREPIDIGTMPARHWWDAELAQGSTRRARWSSIPGPARRPATPGGPATRRRPTPTSTATSPCGSRPRS